MAAPTSGLARKIAESLSCARWSFAAMGAKPWQPMQNVPAALRKN
jgi:hypothetical protein